MNLIERVKNIIVTPKTEWPVIDNESHSGMPLIVSYLVPLALVSTIATFIGFAFLTSYGSVKFGLIQAVISFVSIFLSVYISAYIIDALAPSFKSEKNLSKSIQLVVYAATPAYIGGILNILPAIGWLGSLAGGIYAIYLFYLGMPILKKTPEENVIVYMIVAFLSIAVIYGIIGYVLARLFLGSMIPTVVI